MVDERSYHKSIQQLKEASSSFGFVAAVDGQDNYQRIWTRDGVICCIAALFSKDTDLIKTAKTTLETLFRHQHAIGYMPSNVTPGTNAVSYGGSAGRADNPCWVVIGLCLYSKETGDSDFINSYEQKVSKCLQVLDAWEFNGRHLIYVPQSGDWADEYIQHGYVLFEQLLRIWALELAASVFGKSEWMEKASHIRLSIQTNYWKHNNPKAYYTQNLSKQMRQASDRYWLMGFNPSRIYPYFDLQANALALFLNIGTRQQDETLLAWISQIMEQKALLIPSFFPTIHVGDSDMQELENNYAYTFRNKPNQFHNGGLWPVWNGLLVMALASSGKVGLAEHLTNRIHKANGLNDGAFNECLDGITNEPCGVAHCAWSAAGAIIAEQSLLKINLKQNENG